MIKALLILCLTATAHAQTYYDPKGIKIGAKTWYYNQASTTTSGLTMAEANQQLSIASHTVTIGKEYYLTSLTASVRFSTFTPDGLNPLGYIAIQISTLPASVAYTTISSAAFTTQGANWSLPLAEPLALSSATTIRALTYPSSTTLTSWTVGMVGYEK